MKSLDEVRFSDFEFNTDFLKNLYDEQGRNNKNKLKKMYHIYCYLKLYYDVFSLEKKYDRPIINLINNTSTNSYDRDIISKIDSLKAIVESLKYSKEVKAFYDLDLKSSQDDNLDFNSKGKSKIFFKKLGSFNDIRRKFKFLKADKNEKITMLSKDTELYFLLNDVLKRDNDIIDTLIANAKYRKDNYGDVLKYASNDEKKAKIKELCKINGFCDLYFFARNIDPSNPFSLKMDDVGKKFLHKKLLKINEEYKLCLLFDNFLNNVDSKYKTLFNKIFGINGKKVNLADALESCNISEKDANIIIRKDFLKSIKRTLLSNNKGLYRIGSISSAALALIVGISFPTQLNALIDKNGDELDNKHNNIGISNDIVSSDLESAFIEKGYMYSSNKSNRKMEFIVVEKFDNNIEESIKKAKNNGNAIGLILRPTGNYDDFKKSIGLISYYIRKYGIIDMPILYDVSSVKDMDKNCLIAKDIITNLESMGCYCGFYGNLTDLKKFDDCSDNIIATNNYDKMVVVSSKEDLLDIPEGYNNMVIYAGNIYFKYDLIQIIKDNKLNSWERAKNVLVSYSIDEINNEQISELVKDYKIPESVCFDILETSWPEADKIFLPIVDEKNYESKETELKSLPKSNQQYVKGIDVSEFNGGQYDLSLDWDKFKEQGVEFAFIRICDYGADGHPDDVLLTDNINGCSSVGLPIGFYYLSNRNYDGLSYNDIENAMSDEANCIINKLKNHGINDGVVFMDIEQYYQDTYINLDANLLNSYRKIFSDNGYTLGFYCSDLAGKALKEKLGDDCIFWITQHESYNHGSKIDDNGIRYYDNDTLINFKNFGSGVTNIENPNYDNDIYNIDNDGDGDLDLDDKVYDGYNRDEVDVIQFCEYGRIDGNHIDNVDIDVARRDFVNDKLRVYTKSN